jgi:exodeoxyribonuclease X
MSNIRIRVIDLETGGNGANEVCEIGWQDVVLGENGRWSLNQERGALLVNPGRPISPDTMAVHHILDAEVADAPFWKEVAPSILRPQGSVAALVAHRAAFEQRYCTPRLAGGLPWICTWKCALRVWPDLTRFSNQMLRS